jgi:phosphate transport system substrate-binding protein
VQIKTVRKNLTLAKMMVLLAVMLLSAMVLGACGDTATSAATAGPTAGAATTTTAAATTTTAAATTTTAAATTTAATTTTAAASTAAATTTTAAMTTTAAAGTAAGTTTAAAGGSTSGSMMAAPNYGSLPKASLNGSGSSLVNPVMQPWTQQFATVASNVSVSYKSVGSGSGQSDFFGGKTDFADSDSVPPAASVQKYGKPILYFPMTLAGVVLAYNLPGVDKLKLDADTIGKIYTGQITTWNDPAIAALNSGANLPNTPISLAVRQDSSGTSNVFTSYLSAISPDFKSKVGAGTQPDWSKAGLQVTAAPQNDGVAGLIKQNAGTLGYLEVAYALQNKIPYASLKNAAGNFVDPTLDNLSAAAASATPNADLTVSLINQQGANAYPITTTTYVIINKDQTDATKAQALLAFIYWATHDGQQLGPKYNYAPLPQSLVDKIDAQLATVTVNGQPISSK